MVYQGQGAIKKCLDEIASISMSQSVSGYTIHVVCNTFPMNDPSGASPAQVIGGDREVWPIQLPPGIVLKGQYVLVPAAFGSWASNPNAQPFVRFVGAPNAYYSGAAKIVDFNFFGGDIAVDTKAGVASGVAQDFGARIDDCVNKDTHYSTYQTIQYVPCKIGLWFKADGGTALSAPHVTGEVLNLVVSGAFPSSMMNPTDPINPGCWNSPLKTAPARRPLRTCRPRSRAAGAIPQPGASVA